VQSRAGRTDNKTVMSPAELDMNQSNIWTL